MAAREAPSSIIDKGYPADIHQIFIRYSSDIH